MRIAGQQLIQGECLLIAIAEVVIQVCAIDPEERILRSGPFDTTLIDEVVGRAVDTSLRGCGKSNGHCGAPVPDVPVHECGVQKGGVARADRFVRIPLFNPSVLLPHVARNQVC
jgi:hypothetical protein